MLLLVLLKLLEHLEVVHVCDAVVDSVLVQFGLVGRVRALDDLLLVDSAPVCHHIGILVDLVGHLLIHVLLLHLLHVRIINLSLIRLGLDFLLDT